jgi:SAM-dependent methyltransferase
MRLLSGRTGLKYRLLPAIMMGFKLFGGRWNDFYAWLVNYQERNTNMKDLIEKYNRDPSKLRREKGLYDIAIGALYVDFLKKHGLQPSHDVLDFGCGYGRVANPLLRYLEHGKYVGVDVSGERIRLAREYVELEGLRDRGGQFYVSPRDNSFDYLGGRKFDVVWARAVLGHMPFEESHTCLAGIRSILKPGGIFIGDFDASDENEGFANTNVKTFRYPVPEMRKMAESLGFRYAEIPDWEDSISPEGRRPYIRMMRLTAA